MPEIISRKEARALGLKRYFTGKQCSRRHFAERSVGNQFCCICEREGVRRRAAAKRQPYPALFCKICGVPFVPKHCAERYCSNECRKVQRHRDSVNRYIKMTPEQLQRTSDRVIEWKRKNVAKCGYWAMRWKMKNPEKHIECKRATYQRRKDAQLALRELGIRADINDAYRALRELGIMERRK